MLACVSEKRISGFLLLVLGAVQVGLCTMLAMGMTLTVCSDLGGVRWAFK